MGATVIVVVDALCAGQFRAIADELLPTGSRHVSTVLESVEAALEAHRRDHPEGAEHDEDQDLNDAPEVKLTIFE